MVRWGVVAAVSGACVAALALEAPRQRLAPRLRTAVPLSWLLLPTLREPPLVRELSIRPIDEFASDATSPDRCRGSVTGLIPPLHVDFFGTHFPSAGPAATTRWRSRPFHADGRFLYVPIVGRPTADGVRISLEVVRPPTDEKPAMLLDCHEVAQPLAIWRIDLSKLRGATYRLQMVDDSTTSWAGIGAPFASDLPDVWSRLHDTRALYWACLLDVVLLLLLPGLAWACGRGNDSNPRGVTALLPLPGVALLALWGLVLWLAGLGGAWWLGFCVRWGIWLTALATIWRNLVWRRRVPPLDCFALAIYAGVVAVAVAYAAFDVDVPQEAYAGTPWRSRMVASPTDHAIPFFTGVFFLHGKSGVDDSRTYFGEWSVGSRGPLMGLVNAACLHAAGLWPCDPPYRTPPGWVETRPMDRQGFGVARLSGILTNALVLLAAGWLLECAGAPPQSRQFGLAWLALSPLVAINVGYVWPKLFATYFICLALVQLVRGGGLATTAVFAAAGYYAHPLAALFVPALFVLAVRGRSALAALRFAGIVAAVVAPWLAYKAFLRHPEPFAGYVLGDGERFQPARSIDSWLSCRLDNAVETLVPAAFFFGPHMHEWLGGPLTAPLRWSVQYAKTLPGHLGFGLFLIAYAALFRPARAGPLRLLAFAIWETLALMLVYWGYSRDGLGRNCLEPISALAIVVAAARIEVPARWHRLGLTIVATETLFVLFGSMWLGPTFDRWPGDLAGIAAATVVLGSVGTIALVGVSPGRVRG